jgi:hypothetical protein
MGIHAGFGYCIRLRSQNSAQPDSGNSSSCDNEPGTSQQGWSNVGGKFTNLCTNINLGPVSGG